MLTYRANAVRASGVNICARLCRCAQYEDYHKGGWKEDNQMSYMDMVNKYYDLATSFYEIGAGPGIVESVWFPARSACASALFEFSTAQWHSI